MTIDYLTNLKVEVQVPTPGLQNLIKNPTGEKGAWGWESPVASTTMTGSGTSLTFLTTVSQAAYFRSELMPIAATRYGVVRYDLSSITASHNLKVRLEWYNAAKVYLSSSTPTVAHSSAGTYFVPAAQAPAGTAYAKVRFDLYNGAGNPSANATATITRAMFATSATSTGFGSTRENLFPDPAQNNSISWGAFGEDTIMVHVGSPSYVSTGAKRWHHERPYAADLFGLSASMSVVAGEFYTASAYLFSPFLPPGPAGRIGHIGIEWYVSGAWQGYWYGGAGALTSNSVWVRASMTMRAPAGATQGRLIMHVRNTGQYEYTYLDAVLFERTPLLKDYFDGNTTDTATVTYDWTGTPDNSTSSANYPSAGNEYQPPAAWLPITGAVNGLNIDREAMNVGTMSVVVTDELLDPAGMYDPILKPGKRVRVLSREGSEFRNLFEGKISNAHVDYDKPKNIAARVRTKITLTAQDAMSDLVNQSEPRSVATVAELPYILEGKGVPWNCNGVTSHVLSASVPVTNDNASVADQVVITRDTTGAQAWVDRSGVLQVSQLADLYNAVYLSDVPVTDTTTNRMTNGGFETSDLSKWTMSYGGTMARSTSAARTGTNGLRITANGTNWAAFGAYSLTVPHPGIWQVTMWVRSSLAGAKFREVGGSHAGEDVLTLTTASTWYPFTYRAYSRTTTSGTHYLNITLHGLSASGGTPANGTTYDLDDVSVTAVAPDGSYTGINVDWDTDRIVNEVQIKHLTINAEGKSEEVDAGVYRDAESIDTYGPKRSTYTIVGTAPNFSTFAGNILARNATPQIRCNSMTVAITDSQGRISTAALALVAKLELCAYVDVYFDTKVGAFYRVATLKHRLGHDGWFIDLTFDTTSSTALPQQTPAPPTDTSTGEAGIVQMFAGTTVPSGWLLCRGQSLTVAAYPALHAAIGYTFGGSGANFNVPNFNARSPIGVGGAAASGSAGNNYSLGQGWGHEAMPNHTHAYDRANAAVVGLAGGGSSVTVFAGTPQSATATGSAGTGNMGNVHPVLGMNFIIKVA